MKYSGVEWIGEIPNNWNVKAIRECLFERNEKNDQLHETTILSLSAKDGVTLYDGENHSGNKPREDLSGYKIVKENDIVANSMNILSGSVGLSKYNGVVSPVYYIYHIRNSKDNIRFFSYIFQCNEFQKNLRRLGKGILIRETEDGKLNTIRTKVPSYQLSIERIPYPNEYVQKCIVELLDKKTKEIDSLIEIENKQIEKLKEYKQAVITESVTKGLDKNAVMKDSGVEWIGKIPEDWRIKRAKFIAEEFVKGSGITKEDVVIDGDIPCVRYGEIYTKYDNYFNECATRTNLSNVPSPTFIEKGDLLFTCTGELVEEIGKNVLYLGEEKCLAGGDIIVMKHKQHPGFINYAMNCTRSQMQKSYGKAKLKVVHISTLGIGNVYVCLPSYAEQKNISDYLDDFTESINEIILIKQQKICQLDEYKKSIIYEYVTGKKEVC